MIGLTIMTIPFPSRNCRVLDSSSSWWTRILRLQFSWRRLVCCLAGFSYPFLILVAIVATANHFVLDAVAGASVCLLGWRCNGLLLNLLPLEDYFLSLVRIHKPDPSIIDWVTDEDAWEEADTHGHGNTVLP